MADHQEINGATKEELKECVLILRRENLILRGQLATALNVASEAIDQRNEAIRQRNLMAHLPFDGKGKH